MCQNKSSGWWLKTVSCPSPISIRIAQSFLETHGSDCIPGGQFTELWAVKEGPTSSVWCASGGCGCVAINISRDRLGAQDLAASAPRLRAAARALPRGSVAEPLAQTWIGEHFVMAQQWVDHSYELGAFCDRSTGASTLARVERFLTDGIDPSRLSSVLGWPIHGKEALAMIYEITGLAIAAARSGVSAGLGATGINLGQGDLVILGEGPSERRCVIVACDGAPVAPQMPDAKGHAAALLADLGVDDALFAAFIAAFGDRIEPENPRPVAQQERPAEEGTKNTERLPEP